MNAPHRLRLRSSLMLGCAACGLAMTWSGEALAQAFQASPTTVFGNVTYNRATPGVETVTVNSQTAVIDWSNPSPLNPFIFLPAGNVATFQNGVNNPDFVALNRILVTVPVRFDGRVVSQIVSASGTSPGGTLLFSTPGGIIIGANAVFDVGNLVLTTLDVNVDAAGNFYDPATRGFTFTSGGLAPSGPITTQAGARINALSPNSYVAFVAPTISHAGNVQVNGAAAYIAASQVEMRANDGLFDIVVSIGSDSAIPITHTGTTGGPASIGAADVHRIYMVAVPRNQAITTLLEGNVGFDSAVNASVENGEIVLSAGYNVVGGSVDSSAPVIPDLAASISIDGGTISSSLTGYAVTDAIASGFGGSDQLHVVQDLTLVAGQTAALIAGPGQVVTMDRNVTLVAPGGSAGIVASQGGSVTIAGNVLIDATGTGFSPPSNVSADATDGVGGEASVYSDGGTIAISGNATLLARGIGGHASNQANIVGRGGNGQGGVARILGINGGTVAITGNLAADASGVGGFTSGYDANTAFVSGASGTGGDVYVLGAGGGAVTVTGSSAFKSDGQGGASIVTVGGTGAGDEVRIQASGGNVTLIGPVSISAVGAGGQGASGGAGAGGELDVNGFRGSVRMGATSADLSGRGGAALTALAAGNGTGGEMNIFAESDTGSIDILSFDGHADGIGADGSSGAIGGAAGAGQGGDIDIETSTDLNVVGARPGVHFGTLSLTANGAGGAGGTGANGGGAAGAGTGGGVTLAASQAPITIDGQTAVSATGTGGVAPAGGGPGGTGNGGQVNATADRTSLALGNANIGANGRGGNGPTGGTGGGGRVQIRALGGVTASSVSGGGVTISATGRGGAGADAGGGAPAGRGGNGIGGSVLMLADAVRGAIAFGATSADAGGTGGNAGNAPNLILSGRGGDGTGGTVTAGTEQNADPNCNTPATCAAAASGSATFASLTISAVGAGGQGGAGGNGSGGATILQSVGAPTIVTGAATLRADAVAGGGTGGGAAGQALGGQILLSASPHAITGTSGHLQAGSVNGTANAIGGGPGSTAGQWQVAATGGAAVIATDLTLAAIGGNVLPGPSRVDVLNGGTVSVPGTATLNSAGTIQINASGAGKLSGGTIRFTAGDDVVVGVTNPAANAVTIDTTDLAIIAGDDVAIGAGAVTRSANGTNVQAGNLATIAGRMLGRSIQIASADIDLSGGIGDAGTQAVTLIVGGATTPTQPTTLGGTAQGPGYTLTAAEAALIRADSLRVNAPAVGTSPTRNPDLIVRDLSLNGGGAIAGIGALTIVTPGIARVQGNLLLTGARATDNIAFAATERLEIVTPNGSVRVRDAVGAPAGTLTLTSNNIWAVGQNILDKLHTDPAYAGRDTDLGDNGGSQAPRGYIEGNSVALNVGNSLFVQNTGANPTNQFSLTGPAFGGITVGPGGLIVRAAGASPASVTAFGRRINADGSETTGYDFFFTADFKGGAGGVGLPTGYSDASTFNTCIIATGQCPLRRPTDTGPGGPDPIVGPPATILLPRGVYDDNVDTSFATEPLIEEPVTSGGESTLWTPPCDPARDQRCVGEHP